MQQHANECAVRAAALHGGMLHHNCGHPEHGFASMHTALQRAVPEDPQFRKLLGAIVVVAANAGGAFTPIGDVTTTVCEQPLVRNESYTAVRAGGMSAGGMDTAALLHGYLFILH